MFLQSTTAGKNVSLVLDSGKPDRTPFERSIQLLLETVMQQQRADVACLYQSSEGEDTMRLCGCISRSERRSGRVRIDLTDTASAWLLALAAPATITAAATDGRVCNFPEVLLHGLDEFLVVPLRLDRALLGVLTIGWRGLRLEGSDSQIASTSAAATALLDRMRDSAFALSLAERIAIAEAELADLKIADRSDASAEELGEHISRVLQGGGSASLLKRQLQELEQQLEDRRILARAKERLRIDRQMTEEQAYLYIRGVSRRERRPLRAVAEQLLNGQM